MEQRDYGDESVEQGTVTEKVPYTINDCTCGVNDQSRGMHHSSDCPGFVYEAVPVDVQKAGPVSVHYDQNALIQAQILGTTIDKEMAVLPVDQQGNILDVDTVIGKIADFFGIKK